MSGKRKAESGERKAESGERKAESERAERGERVRGKMREQKKKASTGDAFFFVLLKGISER